MVLYIHLIFPLFFCSGKSKSKDKGDSSDNSEMSSDEEGEYEVEDDESSDSEGKSHNVIVDCNLFSNQYTFSIFRCAQLL